MKSLIPYGDDQHLQIKTPHCRGKCIAWGYTPSGIDCPSEAAGTWKHWVSNFGNFSDAGDDLQVNCVTDCVCGLNRMQGVNNAADRGAIQLGCRFGENLLTTSALEHCTARSDMKVL